MAVKTVKVTALRSSLYYNGVPYCLGDSFELPEHMLQEWLGLGFIEVYKAPAVKVDESKPAEAPPVSEDELLRKMLEEEEAQPETPKPRQRPRSTRITLE